MFLPNPLDYWRASIEAVRIMTESQVVIGLRLAGFAGFWPMDGAEGPRMLAEKLQAGAMSSGAALRVGLAGGSLPEIALAAMKPVRRRTRANARRLRRELGETP
jgi:hypothetical protein